MISESIQKLDNWIEKNGWEGYDPYDGLKSYLKNITFNKYLRTALVQANKRSPVNIRPILGIKKGINPKGMALFASAYLNLYKKTNNQNYKIKAEHCLNYLEKNQNRKYHGSSWGYNFDWENRIFFLPAYEPSIVVTSVAAQGFIDSYEITKNKNHIRIARSACDFVIKDLNSEEDEKTLVYSYTPYDKSQIYNANMFAARLFSNVYKHTKEEILIEKARKIINHTMMHQRSDGAWTYGGNKKEKSILNKHSSRRIDNFHTGFVLDSMYHYLNSKDEKEVRKSFEKGLKFYKKNHFEKNIPKFTDKSLYPIDIHSCAQGIISFSLINEKKAAKKIAEFTIKEMQDKKGYFHYQKKRLWKNKTPMIRWGQAWMLYALSKVS
ncbi:MAG: delta-aminolevulinic acid dehydratase [Candidatus Woesearchaeota archaeon]